MLRTIVLINFTPIIDTDAVRINPMDPVEGTMCTYKMPDGTVIRQRYDSKNGAAKLAIKLLKKTIKRELSDIEINRRVAEK